MTIWSGGISVDGESEDTRKKGQMARRLVYFCIGILTVTAVWAAVVVTIAVALDRSVDLSSVLTFIGGAFGGELLLLLLKRVLAKPNESVE